MILYSQVSFDNMNFSYSYILVIALITILVGFFGFQLLHQIEKLNEKELNENLLKKIKSELESETKDTPKNANDEFNSDNKK